MVEFIAVATTDEIPPGDRLVVEIGRRWVAIFNVAGTYYAIEDRCTHDDGPLAEGILTGTTIECPRHGACFDITNGKVLTAPAMVDVPSYQVQVEGNEIRVASR